MFSVTIRLMVRSQFSGRGAPVGDARHAHLLVRRCGSCRTCARTSSLSTGMPSSCRRRQWPCGAAATARRRTQPRHDEPQPNPSTSSSSPRQLLGDADLPRAPTLIVRQRRDGALRVLPTNISAPPANAVARPAAPSFLLTASASPNSAIAAVLVVDERVEPDRHAADEQRRAPSTSSRSSAAAVVIVRPPAARPSRRLLLQAVGIRRRRGRDRQASAARSSRRSRHRSHRHPPRQRSRLGRQRSLHQRTFAPSCSAARRRCSGSARRTPSTCRATSRSTPL